MIVVLVELLHGTLLLQSAYSFSFRLVVFIQWGVTDLRLSCELTQIGPLLRHHRQFFLDPASTAVELRPEDAQLLDQ